MTTPCLLALQSPSLIDSHLHLSQGIAELREQDYQKRMASELGKMCLARDFKQLHSLQEPLVEHVLSVLQAEPTLQLHVQSVSFIDSIFNYALLTHSRLHSKLNRSLFLYVGLHPWFISSDSVSAHQELSLLCDFLEGQYSSGVITGIGEIGLDKNAQASLDLQQDILVELLKFNQSSKLDLPLSLHCYKAHNELIRILKESETPLNSEPPANTGTSLSTKASQDSESLLKTKSQMSSQTTLLPEAPYQGKDYLLSQTVRSQVIALPQALLSHTVHGLSRGGIHGFNSSVPIALRYCELNFKLGLGLMWARPERANKLLQLLKAVQRYGQPLITESDFDQQCYEIEPLKNLSRQLALVQSQLLNPDYKAER